MTSLNCSATTCMYNKNALCSRGNIEVTGEQAHRADETSCGSFHDRENTTTTNSTADSCGCEKIQIDCKAQSCTYNNSCKCTASAIDIKGNSAGSGKETECSTFYCGSRA